MSYTRINNPIYFSQNYSSLEIVQQNHRLKRYVAKQNENEKERGGKGKERNEIKEVLYMQNTNNNNDNNDCTEGRKSRFFAISSMRRELSPTCTLKWPGRNRVQITCNISSAYRMQHVKCRVVRRDSSAVKFDTAEIAFILAFSMAETIKR